ncbi:unnamed protein product [Allacma fusca]|uniref:Zasp-like motif domain-containing protein n=1 Tax=Allacma fusca TaxID=39272 RepID=A0A8J2K315_9HEXA|nr:unnamed protein product [Allacma fusca]
MLKLKAGYGHQPRPKIPVKIWRKLGSSRVRKKLIKGIPIVQDLHGEVSEKRKIGKNEKLVHEKADGLPLWRIILRLFSETLDSKKGEIGNYRLQRVLSQLEDMATLASPRSPLFAHALNSPVEFLPVTRFPTNAERIDQIHEVVLETQKEREIIQNQPYRTTQLVFPGVKPRPDLVNNKISGTGRPTVYRPLDERSVVAKLDENRAIVNRQFNSPGPLYSQQNVNEAVYVQTGVNLAPPVIATPVEFNPSKSPTFQALIEEEQPVKILPAPNVQRNPPPQKYAHATAPSSHVTPNFFLL